MDAPATLRRHECRPVPRATLPLQVVLCYNLLLEFSHQPPRQRPTQALKNLNNPKRTILCNGNWQRRSRTENGSEPGGPAQCSRTQQVQFLGRVDLVGPV